MLYVGVDKHESQSRICVLDGGGRRVREWTLWGPPKEVVVSLKALGDRLAVCFEASTGTGYFCDLLKGVSERVVVAPPGQTRLIFRAKRKNDPVDAQKLAKLLYLDEVPPVHVPKL